MGDTAPNWIHRSSSSEPVTLVGSPSPGQSVPLWKPPISCDQYPNRTAAQGGGNEGGGDEKGGFMASTQANERQASGPPAGPGYHHHKPPPPPSTTKRAPTIRRRLCNVHFKSQGHEGLEGVPRETDGVPDAMQQNVNMQSLTATRKDMERHDSGTPLQTMPRRATGGTAMEGHGT